MSRGPRFSIALLCYGVLVRVAAGIADASTLRDTRTSHSVLRGGAVIKEHSAQHNGVGEACQNPPCPCLVTPAPIVTADDLQASRILLAADTAMAKGITLIGEAADQAGDASLKEIQEIDTHATQKETKATLAAAEANATAHLDVLLATEMQRQAKLETAMEVDAKNAATSNAAHVRQTSEEWAKHQALHYMTAAADVTLKGALMATESIPQIRQRATEQAKGAIDASAEALTVAQKAQAMAQIAPKELILDAAEMAEKVHKEQLALINDIDRVYMRSESLAEDAKSSHDLALKVLSQAIRDVADAKQALQNTTINAEKIARLQENTQVVTSEAATLNEPR